jgi:TonB family protein
MIMIQNKSTFYSLAGSLAVNMMITMGAGSFLISINKNLATQKTYKLEFVKKKPPPLIKKKKINKEIVRQQIKMPVLQTKPLPVVQSKTAVAKSHKKVFSQEVKIANLQPKALPTIQPKMTVRQTSSSRPTFSIPNYSPRQIQTQKSSARQSSVIHSSSSIKSRRVAVNIPIPRSFTTIDNKKSQKRSNTMAMLQDSTHFKSHNIPKLLSRSSASTSSFRKSKGRVTPILSGMKHASLSFPINPRSIPNIVDRGALTGYLGQIQRIIEHAKEYPEASRRAGREGKITVQFTIFRNGNVDNIKLLTRTPYPNLNQEAIDAVERSAPFSGFPDSLTQKSVKVILPFRFELR